MFSQLSRELQPRERDPTLIFSPGNLLLVAKSLKSVELNNNLTTTTSNGRDTGDSAGLTLINFNGEPELDCSQVNNGSHNKSLNTTMDPNVESHYYIALQVCWENISPVKILF